MVRVSHPLGAPPSPETASHMMRRLRKPPAAQGVRPIRCESHAEVLRTYQPPRRGLRVRATSPRCLACPALRPLRGDSTFSSLASETQIPDQGLLSSATSWIVG